MIDEKTIELLVERLVRRVENSNTLFLKKIGNSIKQIKNLKPSEAYKLVQILKYGGKYEEIIKELSKYTDLNINDLDEIFSNYAKKDQLFYEKFYRYRNIPFVPFDENNALKKQTDALKRIAKKEMYDYLRTNVLGYTISDNEGNVVFKGLKEAYNDLLDTALLNVGQGKEDFDSAMTKILKEVGRSGLKTINYASGRNVRLDSAIRMHLKSRLRELHNENQLIFGEEFGADGVEISVHENPAVDHQKAQGRQFSIIKPNENELSEWEKLQSGQEATDYKGVKVNLDHDNKSGYRPISEMNCYHYIFSIILGVSEPEYSEQQLQDIINKNNEGFELDGKHYTNYEGTQLQRALERRIREEKDVQILAKSSGNNELMQESQRNIKELSIKYKELSDVSGLPTKVERLRVSGYHRTKYTVGETQFKDYNIQHPATDYKKHIKDFNFPSNEALDEYVKQSSEMSKRMAEDSTYKKQMYELAEEIEPLKRPLKENTILYVGLGKDETLDGANFVISTTIGYQTAHGYSYAATKNLKEINIATIFAEQGAEVISTVNTKSKQFNTQGELIIPISKLKKLYKIGKNKYLYRK